MNITNHNSDSVVSTYNNRHARLAVLLHTAGLDALVLNPGPTLQYLTGLEFHLSERPIVGIFRPHSPTILILPELETGKLRDYLLPVQAFSYRENPTNWAATFRQGTMAAHLSPAKVGIEPGRLRVLELRFLEDAAHDAGFVSAEAVISEMRMKKDETELAAMRKAVVIAQEALKATLPIIKSGVTEREIAAELTLQLLRRGSSPEIPFAPIVASGPNSANPHAFPTDRKLREGDLLVIDWGARYQGYISDMTRTFAIGPVDPEFSKIAEIVKQANLEAQRIAKTGIAAGAVDQAARQIITNAGYGKYFMHRTGHGLGMEGHEPPYLYTENELELTEGTTFTIEPGIYLPEQGGVRIEDDFVITETGGESLSDLPRELIQLG